jgi:exonuclease SbcC
MEVEFEFTVGGNHYRVLRKRSKGGLRRAGQSLLELQVLSPEGYTPITGNTIGETQRKIIDVLRMDYQTFINSALLLQGRANEFSMKRPGERKEVLANILELSLYDELERLARDQSKEKDLEHRTRKDALARIEQQLEQKGQYETDLAAAQSAMSETAGEVERLESALAQLRQSRDALRFKKEQSQEIDRQIDQARRQIEYLESRAVEHRGKIEKFEKVLGSYDKEYASVHAQLAQLKDQEEELNGLRGRAEEVSNRIHLLQSTNAQLKTEMEGLKGKLDMLGREEARCPLCGTELGLEGREQIMANYEQEGKEKAESYRANAREIQGHEAGLRELRQAVEKTESTAVAERSRCERRAEALERERAEANTSLPQENEALKSTENAINDMRSTLAENSRRKSEIVADIEGLPRIDADLAQADRLYREIRDRERALQNKLIETEAGLRRCAQLEKEKAENAEALRALVEEKAIYDELSAAFGKRGIQAMIIESALPELEEEANLLLGRMTDNRMHLKIESQRDTKKGDTIETLEIRISDELGTRSYEMFSGGEAFRVDFALRIALSRLLANRAGAPLPTLIIDEGFGTQDSGGREKLVEAITSIQDDFEKILVITHIEELKDAFPVRIEVTKTEEGSTFALA